MALYEEDMMEDLANEEAEGAADAYDEGFDEFDEFDEFEEGEEFDEGDEFDEFDEGDEFEAMDAYDEGDEFDEFGEGEEFEEGDESLEEAMAEALASEDSDEFLRRAGGLLRRAARGAVRAARRAAPVIGRIARTAAPVLRLIPHPVAQGAATAANLLGRLRMEGASEEDALEAMAELAARNPRAVPMPVIAGLAARAVVRRAGAAMPAGQRRQVVRNMATAARTLVRRQGPPGIRALPRIARSVRRTAAVRRTPPAVRPRVALNTARRVAASPRLARRLARPLPRGRALVRRAVRAGAVPAVPGRAGRPPLAGGRRSITTQGPVRITIRGR
jgi:hypothetical protein